MLGVIGPTLIPLAQPFLARYAARVLLVVTCP
jgi:hypothetical protein